MDEGRIKAMVNLIGVVDDDDGFLGHLNLGHLGTVRACTVPAKSFVKRRCKDDVKGMDLEFLCSEQCQSDWDEDLVVTESVWELKQGRNPYVNLEIRNASSVDKYLPKNME